MTPSREDRDRRIVEGLIGRDENITREFFFCECVPLFRSIIQRIYSYPVDYDEFVGELYLHIMENDAKRLRSFGFTGSLFSWLKIVAIRYFCDKHDRLIENRAAPPLLESKEGAYEMSREVAAGDIEALLERMPNKRYALIIRRLVIDDGDPKEVSDELGIRIENLYNIKKRAMDALLRVALTDIKHYEKE